MNYLKVSLIITAIIVSMPTINSQNNFEGVIVNNCTFVYSNFYVQKCLINESYIGDKENEVFFVIIAMTDFIDTVNYSHMNADIISRNHPDYLAKGWIKTKTNDIDYTAFITGDRGVYAIDSLMSNYLRY